MKSKLFVLTFSVVIIICFFSCINKHDVIKEISIYHACVTICELKAEEQKEHKVTPCESQCRITHNNARNRCTNKPENALILCLSEADNSCETCKQACHIADAQIYREFQKCKQTCVPVFN